MVRSAAMPPADWRRGPVVVNDPGSPTVLDERPPGERAELPRRSSRRSATRIATIAILSLVFVVWLVVMWAVIAAMQAG
jgi:hypothetical protein